MSSSFSDTYLCVNFDCLLDRIQNHRGNRPPGVSVREFLEEVSEVGRRTVDWILGLNEEERGWQQHLAVLAVQLLPPVPLE